MPPRARSASKQRSSGPQPIFAGVDRQAPRAQQARSWDSGLSLIGEQCRLFDDESGLAGELEAGQHLLPCYGDEGITVDRFDARLLLPAAPAPTADRSRASAPATNFQEEAQLDAERYRDLQPPGGSSSDSDADDAQRRPGGAAIPHNYGGSTAAPAASCQQVGYDYGGQQPEQHEHRQSAAADTSAEAAAEQGEPFVVPFSIPQSLQANLPATMQQHKVIAQTAGFVRETGGQSEFRLGVAQAGNPNFAFLRPDDRLFPYYRWLLQTNPQDSMTAGSLQGPTGLDMLAASYDTDQASDPPTPRTEQSPPQGAGGGDMQAAAAQSDSAAAATADADDSGSAAAGAAAPTAAVSGATDAGPHGPAGPSAASVTPSQPAAPPAATQAIMNKLVDFVKQLVAPHLSHPPAAAPAAAAAA